MQQRCYPIEYSPLLAALRQLQEPCLVDLGGEGRGGEGRGGEGTIGQKRGGKERC